MKPPLLVVVTTAMASFTLAGPVEAQETTVPTSAEPKRMELAIVAGAVRFEDSAYSRALRVFDHDKLVAGMVVGARVTRLVRPWFHLGARLGLTHTESQPATLEGDVTLPSDPITFQLVDASAVMRLVYLDSPRHGGVRLDAGLDAGFVAGWTSMRGSAQRILAPRAELSAFFGYETRWPGGHFGLRGGYVVLPWNGAGGSWRDPVFSGALLTVEGGAVL